MDDITLACDDVFPSQLVSYFWEMFGKWFQYLVDVTFVYDNMCPDSENKSIQNTALSFAEHSGQCDTTISDHLS